MILISIILIYIAGNLRMLHHLNRDLQLVEQKQIQRLNSTHSRTNAPAAPKPVGTTSTSSP